jgi:hypothetical protein
MRRIVLASVVLALALAAAGCGGSDEESDPTAAWAAGFCTAVTDWTDALGDVTSQFTDTSNLNEDGLRSAADDVRTSTEQLVDEIRGLGAPDTESGEEIRSSLDELSSTLETEVEKISEAVDGASGITGLASAITAASASLSAMGSAFAGTLQSIGDSDVGGELQAALEDSPECAGISD